MKVGPHQNYEVIGVASILYSGIGCCSQALYIRISAFLRWIKKNLDHFEDPYYEFPVTYEQIRNPDFFYMILYAQRLNIYLLDLIFAFYSLIFLIPTVFTGENQRFGGFIIIGAFLFYRFLLQEIPILALFYTAFFLVMFRLYSIILYKKFTAKLKWYILVSHDFLLLFRFHSMSLFIKLKAKLVRLKYILAPQHEHND